MLLSADRSAADTETSLSFEVIAAVAEREGVDPTDIEPPTYDALYDVINPEALDALFSPREDGTPRADGQVEFPFCGYHVVVTSDGDVELEDGDSHLG
ncbi:HalOD1 output domain-containing protein [Halopiger goleimassiliensis]|uniref:HalOD1 output domain-containing protein n=1 Tax=Halopiger goleimassiliensis TaxID=1293048 RepID=UPI000677DA37|nr:HalOD1 output domain-containing protein [Halopiger goleimassiliensis]